MAAIGGIITFNPGSVILSSQVNNNFSQVQTTYNAHDTATTGVHGAGANSIVLSTDGGLVPIGTILAFYDYSGSLTFSTKYTYCNGQTATITGIGTKTLPDLSNRYLVGFGTEGGGDIGTATWSITPVGIASHVIDISHTHTLIHTHTYSGTTGTPSSLFPANGGSNNIADSNHTHGFSGTTSGASQSTSSVSLSSSQSIQPRSILVRYIMRIA